MRLGISFLNVARIGLVLLALALVPLHFYFQPGVPYTHDGENHLARFANYKIAVREGQIPPRFAPNLANRYGYPVFNYNYPLANLLSLPFSVVKVHYQLTFKLLMGLAVVAGTAGTWWWLRAQGRSKTASTIGAAVFALNPYLVSALLYRGSIGEVMALGLIPWLLGMIEWLRRHNHTLTSMRWLLLPVLWMCFFLAHNVTVLMATPLILLYAVARFWPGRRTEVAAMWQKWWSLGMSLVVGVGLSLWFWLPAWMEKSEVVLDQANLSVQFYQHFVTIPQLLFSALQFGYAFVGSVDSLSFQIGVLPGLIVLFGVVVSLKILLQKARGRAITSTQWAVLVGTLVVFGLCSLQLSISEGIWQTVPLLRFIQFPWRFMLVTMVAICFLAVQLYEVLSGAWRKVIWLIVVAQVVVLFHLKPVDLINKPSLEYDSFSQTTSTLNENLPTTFTYGLNQEWQPSPVFVSGEGQVEVLDWTGSHRRYNLEVTSLAVIAEPTMYFLGWETYVTPADSQVFQVEYYNSEEVGGRLAYRLPTGKYEVRSEFTQRTWARQAGIVTSIIFCLGLGIWGLRVSWSILRSTSRPKGERRPR